MKMLVFCVIMLFHSWYTANYFENRLSGEPAEYISVLIPPSDDPDGDFAHVDAILLFAAGAGALSPLIAPWLG